MSREKIRRVFLTRGLYTVSVTYDIHVCHHRMSPLLYLSKTSEPTSLDPTGSLQTSKIPGKESEIQ